jgi:hypothetical protein
VFHGGQRLDSPLGAALAQFPKAAVALHPVDAPLHVLSLPPLPTSRRDAALRVTLEDAVLGDTSALSLSVLPLGGNRFSVACTATDTLRTLNAALQALGQGSRSVVALAACLPVTVARCHGRGRFASAG